MTDLLFGIPITVHRLNERSHPLPAENGRLIQPGEYYIEDDQGRVYSLQDVSSMDFYGDIQVTESGDLALISGTKQDEQMIVCRVRTSGHDWPHHPWIGANLEDLKGMPNTRETAETGARMILDTLTRDNRFEGRSIEVLPIPTGRDEITFLVFMDGQLATPITANL